MLELIGFFLLMVGSAVAFRSLFAGGCMTLIAPVFLISLLGMVAVTFELSLVSKIIAPIIGISCLIGSDIFISHLIPDERDS